MTWSKITINGIDYPIKNKDQFTILKDSWPSYYDGRTIETISFSAELENGDTVIGRELEKGDWTLVRHNTCPKCGEKLNNE